MCMHVHVRAGASSVTKNHTGEIRLAPACSLSLSLSPALPLSISRPSLALALSLSRALNLARVLFLVLLSRFSLSMEPESSD